MRYLLCVRENLARIAAWPRRIVRDISVVTRLSLVIVLVALISLAITSIVGLQRGGQIADTVLQARVTSLGATRADEVERYVGSLQRAAVGQAISPSTAQAINDFTDAYRELNSESAERRRRNRGQRLLRRRHRSGVWQMFAAVQ